MGGGHFWEVITYGGSTVNTHLGDWKYDAAIKIWKKIIKHITPDWNISF